MIAPDSVLGTFVLTVARLRELQQTPLSALTVRLICELDAVTADVDSQLAMILCPSVMDDQFGSLILSARGNQS